MKSRMQFIHCYGQRRSKKKTRGDGEKKEKISPGRIQTNWTELVSFIRRKM